MEAIASGVPDDWGTYKQMTGVYLGMLRSMALLDDLIEDTERDE